MGNVASSRIHHPRAEWRLVITEQFFRQRPVCSFGDTFFKVQWWNNLCAHLSTNKIITLKVMLIVHLLTYPKQMMLNAIILFHLSFWLYYSDRPRTTVVLSFHCRHLHCDLQTKGKMPNNAAEDTRLQFITGYHHYVPKQYCASATYETWPIT